MGRSRRNADLAVRDVLERFRDRRTLIEAALRQPFVCHDRALAERLADCAALEKWKIGEVIIEQGSSDRDLFLIFAGEVSIQVNGREVAFRSSGQHVGEMALIDAHAQRSATVVAKETTVTARVSEEDFSRIANAYPFAWRCLASELADRLRQRNRYVRLKNEIPLLFLGSSLESLPILKALQSNFASDPFHIQPWTTGVFGASTFPIDDLEDQIGRSDFAALLVGPDDLVTSRSRKSFAPRDNVVFELGLFMGALGRKRVFIVAERGLQLKIPSDLLGLGKATYPAGARALPRRLASAAQAIRDKINQLGPL
jgi:CRP/FNR family cyclic AMP-dependent transcriptional regulator